MIYNACQVATEVCPLIIKPHVLQIDSFSITYSCKALIPESAQNQAWRLTSDAIKRNS